MFLTGYNKTEGEGRKEGNALFNNTFYLRLYGVRHMVKDHSDSKRGNLLPPHGLLFPISSNGSFICTIPDRIAHTGTTAFVIPVLEHWLEREIAQWIHHEGSIWRPIVLWANALTTELHLAPRRRRGNLLNWFTYITHYLMFLEHFKMIKRMEKLYMCIH